MPAELDFNVSSPHDVFLNQSNTVCEESNRPGFEIFLHYILDVLPQVT